MKQAILTARALELLAELKTASDHVTKSKLIADLDERGVKASAIQKHAGIADYELRHYRRVYTKLTPEVFNFFQQGKISFSQAKVLASSELAKQEFFAREAIAKRLSVVSLRKRISGNHSGKFIRDLERLSNSYSEQTGFDIQIIADSKNEKAGKLVISYHNLDMFDAISEKLVGLPKDEY